MGTPGDLKKAPSADVQELSEYNIKLYLGVKEFLSTLSTFGEVANSEMNLNGGVKTI